MFAKKDYVGIDIVLRTKIRELLVLQSWIKDS